MVTQLKLPICGTIGVGLGRYIDTSILIDTDLVDTVSIR